MSYTTDTRTEEAAQSIITEHHPHLIEAKICYLMKESAGEVKIRAGKRLKIASAQKVPEKMRAADCPFDFIITINLKIWDKLKVDQQNAVLDHELEHCAEDQDGFFLRDHDVEEFASVIKRRGFYFEALREFVEMAQEAQLPFGDPFKTKRDKESGVDSVAFTNQDGSGVRWENGVAAHVIGEGEIFYIGDNPYTWDGSQFVKVEVGGA